MERFFDRFQRRNKLEPSYRRDGPEAPQGSKPSGSRGRARKRTNKNIHAQLSLVTDELC